jgi:hypothetical protein
MHLVRRIALAVLVLGAVPWTATAGVGIGIGIGVGGPCYRHYYPYRFGFYYGPGPYYYPAPVYVAPPPVVVAPAPVVVAQPVVSAAPAISSSGAMPEPPVAVPADPTPLPPPRPLPATRGTGVEDVIRQLNSADEHVRADAAVELGRMHASRGVGPLIRLLKADRSPAVREAAARGLGLIGEANALAALQNAAQADEDRDVRHSASFAADIIRSRLR